MQELTMQVVHLHCAGIDVGSRFHAVAVDQNRENVKEFGVYSCDQKALIDHLVAHQIETVAMESTGNYWQTLYDAIQKAGIRVELVNGNQTKNAGGKKTDTLDCLWIQKLHSLGLLSGSFLPQVHIQELKTYYRHRQYLISQCSRYTNKMQKALRLMNIRLDIAINDIMGLSGRAIIEAILAGETDPEKLANLVNYRVKKSKSEIGQALAGNGRSDLLFELSSCLSLHDTYLEKIRECDKAMEQSLKKVVEKQKEKQATQPLVRAGKQKKKYTPVFDVEQLSYQYYGVNLMEIPSVGVNTVLSLLTQIGPDMHKFPSAKHFCSWLRLAPNNKITGGKVISSRTPKGKNQLALALRQAANSVGHQKEGDLAAFFRRIAFKKDRPSAITATARKLATILFHMVTKKQAYQPAHHRPITTKAKNRLIQNIRTKMKTLELTRDQLEFLFMDSSPSTA